MIGQTLGHYRLLEQIGAGGMGVVYLARDEQLDRDVAVKVLPAGTLANEEDRRRFRKEALSLARLNHPNVAIVHAFSSSEGQDFLVTEYIPGVSLDEKIAGQPLPIKLVLDLGLQLTRGLAAAHEQGVVHRDLKPGNLRLTPDGRLKILDFGLAQLTHPESDLAATITRSTTALTSGGTVPYMSPEQLRGEAVDHRGDLWAAGAVLYEMATGRRPFPEERGALLINAILNEEPELPRAINPQVPQDLENILLKALEKAPARRYQSAQDLGNDLERLASGLSPVSASRRRLQVDRAIKIRRAVWVAALVMAALLGSLAVRNVRERLSGLMLGGQEKHIAVLPFDNIGNDPANEAVAEGLMDSMSSKLSNLDAGQQSLWVVPASVVRRRKVDDPMAALRELGATLVVKGSIQHQGQAVRLTVNLINAKDLRQIGSVELEDPAGDIATLQNEAVARLARMMNSSVTPEMVTRTGENVAPASYELYLKALGYLQRYDKPGNLDQAIAALTSAVKGDPRFAVGYSSLGEAYRLKYQIDKNPKWIEEATANCKRAIEFNDQLPAAYVTLGRIHNDTGQQDLAVTEFNQALRLDAKNADALNGMAHAYESAGRLKEAEAAYQKAAALRPDYWDGYNTLGLFYDRQNRYEDSIAQLKQALALTPDNAQVYLNLGAVYLDTADPKHFPEAEKALQKSISLVPSAPAYSNLGYLYQLQRKWAEAAAATEKALQFNDREMTAWANLRNDYQWLDNREKEAYARARMLELTEQAAKANPRDAQIQGTLAFLYAAQRDSTRALPRAQSALALGGDDPNVLALVASTYELLGNRQQALAFTKRAVDKGYSRQSLEGDPELQSLIADPAFASIQPK